ncbi:hypothetical protein EW15_1991 [Prochlorococcus sp. MIT 0801]|nr:hypothetical protein EW15_1991 [Prochlorococcus sp. MIT 0801]
MTLVLLLKLYLASKLLKLNPNKKPPNKIGGFLMDKYKS